jgi:CheY-like chemotaxis protein
MTRSTTATQQNQRILIVDDDDDFANSLKEALEASGYELTRVTDVETAVNELCQPQGSREGTTFADSGRYACAIIDLQLPKTSADYDTIAAYFRELGKSRDMLLDRNTPEATKQAIRRQRYITEKEHIKPLIHEEGGIDVGRTANLKNIPVVFLTSRGAEAIIRRASEAVPNAPYLVKPTLTNDLLKAMRSAMRLPDGKV